jgi:hypothetical protein
MQMLAPDGGSGLRALTTKDTKEHEGNPVSGGLVIFLPSFISSSSV